MTTEPGGGIGDALDCLSKQPRTSWITVPDYPPPAIWDGAPGTADGALGQPLRGCDYLAVPRMAKTNAGKPVREFGKTGPGCFGGRLTCNSAPTAQVAISREFATTQGVWAGCVPACHLARTSPSERSPH